jgi:hypothetical protein
VNDMKKTVHNKSKVDATTSRMVKENHVKLKLILEEVVSNSGSHRTSLAKANSCREIVANAKAICEKIVVELVLKWKTDVASDERIRQNIHGYERIIVIIGTLDACFYAFTQSAPTPTDMMHAREVCCAIMREWRAQGFKIPPKAHICEHHEGRGGLNLNNRNFESVTDFHSICYVYGRLGVRNRLLRAQDR